MLFLVSSAPIKSTSFKVLTTLYVISSRFPIGVAHKYNFPAISTSILQNAKIHIFCVFP